ncbi:fibrocystin-L-like [Anneissia japonica]|uniref:fibrocystin-L-like n=1 Tax=Anneissia japonica TaxID=1529436 RepID=UPI001425645E|nr:fibrocystin-L-like [Anneissia japonica]
MLQKGVNVLLLVCIFALEGIASTIYKIRPNRGSFRGATRITISGNDFSPNQFNFGDGNENNGNRVYFRSATATVECDVITYWTTESTIYCDTRAASPGQYSIYLTVDGQEVGSYCSKYKNCNFMYESKRTPKIRSISPRAGTPDTLLKFYGFIVSDIVTPSQTQFDDYKDSSTAVEIQRVYMGSSICDPIDQETGTVYGIDKNSNGWGTITCKPNSTVADSKNITFLVSSEYGRSYTELGAYSVSFGGELYLFQVHAEIREVTPGYGSIKGGTLIKIRGEYFGTSAENVDVDVGGVDCQIFNVQDNLIECITAARSSNRTLFPGNRGIYREVWRDTNVNNYFSDAIWNTSAPDYFIELRDEFKSPNEPSFGETDYYSSRYRGYFVAPYDGQFRFLIYSDDQSELYFSMTQNPENKVKIAFNSWATNNFYTRWNEQVSELLTLVGGDHYYLEAYHREGYGADYLNVGLMMYDLPISNAEYNDAINEVQTISITSTKNNEIQILSLDGSYGEVQTIELFYPNCSLIDLCDYLNCSSSNNTTVIDTYYICMELNCSVPKNRDVCNQLNCTVSENGTIENRFVSCDQINCSVSYDENRFTEFISCGELEGTFNLTFSDESTGKLFANATAVEVQDALNNLPSIVSTPVFVNESSTSTAKVFEIYFPPIAGDVEQVMCFSEDFQVNSSTIDLEKTPTIDTFVLILDDVESTALSSSSSAKDIEDALVEVFSVQCQMSGPTGDYTNDYEGELIGYESGVRVLDVEPFCGRFSLKNPKDIYRSGETKSSDGVTLGAFDAKSNGKVCLSYRGALSKSVVFTIQWTHQEEGDLTSERVYQINELRDTNSWRYTCFDINNYILGDDELLYNSRPGSSWNVKIIRLSNTGGDFYIDNLNIGASIIRYIPTRTAARPNNIFVTEVSVAKNEEDNSFNITLLAANCAYGFPLLIVKDANITSGSTGKESDYVRYSSQDWDEGTTIAIGRFTAASKPVSGSFIMEWKGKAAVAQVTCSAQQMKELLEGYLNTGLVTVEKASTCSSASWNIEWAEIGGNHPLIEVNGTNLEGDDVAVRGSTDVDGALLLAPIPGDYLRTPHTLPQVAVTINGVISSCGDGNCTFAYSSEYTPLITNVDTHTGSEAEKTTITITGTGFSSVATDNIVEIGDIGCKVVTCTDTKIVCIVQNGKAGAYDIKVNVIPFGYAATYDSKLFLYFIFIPNTSFTGGDTLLVTGTSLGTKKPTVTINKKECSLTTFNETSIKCIVPENKPGTYDVMVSVPGKGYAKVGVQTKFSYILVIDDVFPDHGSLQGGTKVYVTGSGFGTNMSLVEVLFGHVPCKVSDVTDDQIMCISGSSGVVHEVTNQGKHEDYGVGYKWDPQVLDIIAGDTVMWQWSTPALVESVGFTVQQTADADSVEYDGHGFYAGPRSKSGKYLYKFNNEGYYYYSSGPVNSDVSDDNKFYLTGVIRVLPYRSIAYPASVTLNGIAAEHEFNAQATAPTDSSGCPGGDDTISICFSPKPTIDDKSKFFFSFWDCSTAIIEKIEPLIGSAEQTITITGSGFSDRNCENEVQIGYHHSCSVIFSNDSVIKCSIETESSLQVGYYQEISLNVKNKGFAHNSLDTPATKSYILVPSIWSVDPREGSLAGGTRLTINGNGFSAGSVNEMSVSLGPESCLIEYFNYTQIICSTTPHDVTGHVFDVVVEINHQSSINIDNQQFNFTYQQYLTMEVHDIYPDTISGPSTTVYINGSNFGSEVKDVTVTFGTVNCAVSSVIDDWIECDVAYVPAGDLAILIHRNRYGNARLINGEFVWGEEVIYSINPNEGSTKGGTVITIDGSGFHNDDTSVEIDGDVCRIIFVNISTVTCITESHSASDVYLVVTTNSLDFPDQSFGFSAATTPTISSVYPLSGNAGDTVTITGTHFGSSTADVEVKIDDIYCIVSNVTSTKITCEVPPHAAGIYTIEASVFNLGKAASETTFQYILTVSGSSPADGSFAGGKMLNITGSGFDEERTTVKVCGNICKVTSGTYTHLQCLIPANNGIDTSTVICDIEVSVDSGLSAILNDSFTYKSSLTAIISSVNPTRGGTGGGTDITITGTGFRSSGNVVTIDGSDCIISTESSTVIKCTTEAHQGSVKAKVRVVTDNEDNVAAQVGPNKNRILRLHISSDGTTLEVDPPLQYEHIAIEQTINGVFLSTKAEVGLLTHNVVVRGSVHDEWTKTIKACEAEFDTNQFATQTCFQGRFGEEIGSDQFGSQIKLFGKYRDQQLVTGRIEYVEVTHAGQAFRLGRYPIHFHFNGDVSGSYVRGCGIHHTFNRAVTIHSVDNLLVEHNVAFDIMGHAYFMEDGIEMGNIIQYNLGIFVKSSSSLLNVDITPAAFWITNPNNTVRHNAAAGGSHFGYWYNMPNHPGGPSFTTSMCPRKMVMGEFYNNSAHAQGWYGLWVFPEYHPMEGGGCNSNTPTQAKFYGLTAWKVERGAECIAVGGVQFHDFLISDADKAGIEFQEIDSGIPFNNDGALAKDCTIIGYSSLSLESECTLAGVQAPKNSGLTIDGVHFINFNNGRCSTLRACAHCKVDQGGFHTRVKNLVFDNSPNKVAFQWQHEHWFEDLDGTLTGFANYIVLPYNPNLPSDHCTSDVSYSVGYNGVFCDETVRLHRMAFNRPLPSSLLYKDALFTNQHGTSSIPYRKKRITHPEGWMITLVEGDTYNFVFEDVDQVTNITYSSAFYNFNNGDYVIMNHDFTQAPDVFATIGVVTNSTKEMVTYENNTYGDYYFNRENNSLYYLVSGKDINTVEGDTLAIKLQVYRCYYLNCTPPVPDVTDVPPPENVTVFLWSSTEAWEGVEEGWGGNLGNGSFAPPKDGDDVVILPGLWIIADVLLPWMNRLYIYGALEIEDSQDHCINATYIFIHGGELIIGWETTPFEHQLNIFLNGNHFTEDIPLPNGPNMGSKVLGVFGRLEMHGVSPNITWTHLNKTINSGDNIIQLAEYVTWAAGDKIVVASTSYEAWETETFMIIEILDGRTVHINETAKYKHIAHTHTLEDGSLTYTEAAEVGLLSRNIKIIGVDYNQSFTESFGARVLIGKFEQDGIEYKGFAKMSNVEFYHSGQEGWTDFYDPRYSVAFLDTGEVTVANPSYVRSCTFHNGFSPAIGIFGASGILIEDNVIHHTVGAGIIAWGSDHQILHNLITLTVFPGTYQNRYNEEDISWPAGIEIESSRNVLLANNTVAGSERVLYHISGENCASKTLWQNNEGHSSLHGVYLMAGDGLRGCTKIANFFIWKTWDYGVYFQISSSVVMSELILADNNIGVMPFVFGPSALSHVVAEKYVSIERSFIIGSSPLFDCDELQSQPENAGQSAKQRAPRGPGGGKAGFVLANFMSGANGAPFKPFHDNMNYPAIAGVTKLDDVTFAYFGSACNVQNYCIMSNPSNEDGIHPMTAIGTHMVSVKFDNRVFIHRPSLGKVNPSDCVDMTCDAKRKVFIKDLDGGILGSSGTVIPDSAFEWDGDPRYGLGDYRIPKMMVTDIDGSRIPYDEKCPHKGIIGTENCIWRRPWQAYECHDYDYYMMIIESMDPDTEVRRLSPIAITSNGYVDLINGPQDHGWCHGYTCQERISTFMAVVASGQTYEMYMSGTNPQHIRLHLLNTRPDQKVVVGIWYANPQRLDVYHQGRYVMPNNGQMDGDTFTWVAKDPNLPNDQFNPTPDSNIYGENYFDRDWKILWVLLRGSKPLDIITSPVVMVTVGVAPVDVDDFYEENLVSNLASLLGIDDSQIRVVDVVREGGRRRRSTEIEVEIEIGDTPSITSNHTQNQNFSGNSTDSNSTLDYDALISIQIEIANAAQTGMLSDALEVEVTSLAMTDPVPPAIDQTDGLRATNETGGPSTGNKTYAEQQAEEEAKAASKLGVDVIYQFPSIMNIIVQPANASEGQPFVVQPRICVLDSNGAVVANLGHSSHPWKMQASLQEGTRTSGGQLVGNTTTDVIFGCANFTDLTIDLPGTQYILDFSIFYPNESTLEMVSTVGFPVKESMYNIVISSQPTGSVKILEKFDVQFDLVDVFTMANAKGLVAKGYNWTATVSLYMPSNYIGRLEGDTSVEVDLKSAQGVFYNLSVDAAGFQYVLEVDVVTVPSSTYHLSQKLVSFDVTNGVSYTGNPVKVALRFLADYATVAAGKEKYLEINFINNFAISYPSVTITNVDIYEGSIMIVFKMAGDTDNTKDAIYSDLTAGRIALTFNGQILEADTSYMLVDGEHYGLNPNPSLFPGWAIALVVVITIIIIIVTLAVIKILFNSNNKVSKMETMELTEKENVIKISGYTDEDEELDMASVAISKLPLNSQSELKILDGTKSSLSSCSRSKSRGFNTPSRSPEIKVTALPPGFADVSHEQVLEDRANMYVMLFSPDNNNFTKVGVLSANLVGTLGDLRKDIKKELGYKLPEQPFALLNESLQDIDGACEKRKKVHETYASDSVLIRCIAGSDMYKLCVCGLVGQFECSLCHSQTYCCPNCQSSDWPSHIKLCSGMRKNEDNQCD